MSKEMMKSVKDTISFIDDYITSERNQKILKNIDDLDWSKYKQYKPIYKTEKKSREHHEGYKMDKTFFTQHIFFKMYEKTPVSIKINS